MKLCACVNGSYKTVAITCANFIALSILVFRSLRATSAVSTVNWRPPCLATTQLRQCCQSLGQKVGRLAL